jgi:site-specific DNA recombinase
MANTTTQEVALIYVRKSMVRSKQDEQSPQRQRALCTQEATRRGWTPEVYPDAKGHRSGRSEKHRPAFRRLKAQLGRPDVQAVIVSSLDRLSRSPKDFFNFLSLLQKHQVELISLREQFDTTNAIGKAFVSMIMIVAALEADIASERTTEYVEFARSQGIHVGNPPFGMSRNEEGALIPNEDAPAARAVLTTFARGDHSFQATADHVNATSLRFRDRKGNRVPFTKDSTRSIVANVLLYAGFIPTTRGKDMALPNDLDDSRSLIDQMAEIYQAIEGKITPLITRDLAERVLSARFKRRRLRIVRNSRLFILTPALHCHACGQEMRGYVHRGKPYYKHKKKSCSHGHGQHNAETLETQALALFRGLALPPGLVDFIREKVRERLKQRPENNEVKQALDALQGKMDRLRELYIEGDLDRKEYTTRRASLQVTITEWASKLGPMDYNIEAILDQLGDLAAVLARGTPGQQKRAVNAVFERIGVGLDGEIKRAEPKLWFAPLFADLAATLNGDLKCPQGTLEAGQAAALLALVTIIPRCKQVSKPT